MQLRKNIQKIGALAGTTAMLLTSIATPVSAQLGDLPSPFIQDGSFNGQIVVGEEAQAEDILGAIDIASSFQARATTPVTVSGSGEVSVEGGEDLDENTLNEALPAEELDDEELEGFFDGTVSFDGQNIDVIEKFEILAGGTRPVTSLGPDGEEDYMTDIYTEVDSESMVYKMEFDEEFDVGPFSDDEEMDLEFLGTSVEVTEIDPDDANPSVTVRSSQEFFVEEGDSIESNGRTVELVRVGQTSVVVEVDGEQEVIENGQDERFGDFEVEVDSIFYQDGENAENGASLRLGGEISQTVSDEDSAEIFGEPEEEDEADWVWDIDFSTGSGTTVAAGDYIGLTNEQDYEGVDADDADERNALAPGDELSLPNERVSFSFASLEEMQMAGVTVTINDEELDLDDGGTNELSNANGFTLSSNDGDSIFEVNGEETEEIYYAVDDLDTPGDNTDDQIEIWYEDGDDETRAAEYETDDAGGFEVLPGGNTALNEIADLIIDDEEIDIDFPDTLPGQMAALSGAAIDDFLQFVFPVEQNDGTTFADGNTDRIHLFVKADGRDYFGDQDEEESAELVYQAASSSPSPSSIGTQDEAGLTTYGVSFEDPESQLGSGSTFEFMVPAEQQTANYVVATQGTSVTQSSGSSDSGAVNVNRIPVGLGVLDSEAQSLIGETPMITVGGPYVNTVSAELLGNPSQEEIEEMFQAGTAKVRMFEDEQALLVAGYNPEDTVRAARVVASYEDYSDELQGSEVEIVFDGSEDVEFREVTSE